MNTIRTKIILFWLLFVLFCLLICLSWPNRVLWLMLLALAVVIRYTKPRLPRAPRRVGLLCGVGFIVLFVSVYIHALHPFSASVLLTTKIIAGLFVAPVFCYTIYLDYEAFRSAPNGQA